jgi:uncharacterized lipoprotein
MSAQIVLAAIAALLLAACDSGRSQDRTQYLMDGSAYELGPELAAAK